MHFVRLVLVASLLLAPSPAFAKTSYLLVCRGGGALYFTYDDFTHDPSTEPQIWITFKRGTEGVGETWEKVYSLAPGQCSWLDRKQRIFP
jgi:hypothetical protein